MNVRRAYLSILPIILSFTASLAFGQRIDSVHVFKSVPATPYTSASANALVWSLHRKHAAHHTLRGNELQNAVDALSGYKPTRHTYGPVKDLTHLAMAFSGGRPVAFGITDDLDLVINFTARTEYRISTWTEHLRVRALLAKMLMEL